MSTRLAGFQKRERETGTKEVGFAMIRVVDGALECPCGERIPLHRRAKVSEDRAYRHIERRHGGMGLVM